MLVFAERALGRAAFDRLGGLLFLLLPWLLAGGVIATLLSIVLHPAQWGQILMAWGAALVALIICSTLAVGAAEDENVSVLPMLPWLGASLSVVLAAVGGMVANSTLLTIALSLALASLAVWLALIVVTGLVAWTTRSVHTQT
jgi:hypothetical protein